MQSRAVVVNRVCYIKKTNNLQQAGKNSPVSCADSTQDSYTQLTNELPQMSWNSQAFETVLTPLNMDSWILCLPATSQLQMSSQMWDCSPEFHLPKQS